MPCGSFCMPKIWKKLLLIPRYTRWRHGHQRCHLRALFGSVWGRDAIPAQVERMRTELPSCGRIAALRCPRPECFWPVDALEPGRAFAWHRMPTGFGCRENVTQRYPPTNRPKPGFVGLIMPPCDAPGLLGRNNYNSLVRRLFLITSTALATSIALTALTADLVRTCGATFPPFISGVSCRCLRVLSHFRLLSLISFGNLCDLHAKRGLPLPCRRAMINNSLPFFRTDIGRPCNRQFPL